jgi:hypothetical protein
MMYTPECGQAYVRSSTPLEVGGVAPTAEEEVRALREQLAQAEALLERWATAVQTARPLAWRFNPAEPELMIAGLVSDAEDEAAVRQASALPVRA